jgi:hypothetical protein
MLRREVVCRRDSRRRCRCLVQARQHGLEGAANVRVHSEHGFVMLVLVVVVRRRWVGVMSWVLRGRGWRGGRMKLRMVGGRRRRREGRLVRRRRVNGAALKMFSLTQSEVDPNNQRLHIDACYTCPIIEVTLAFLSFLLCFLPSAASLLSDGQVCNDRRVSPRLRPLAASADKRRKS